MSRELLGLSFLLTLACTESGETGKEDTSSTNNLDDSGDIVTDADGDGYAVADGDCDDEDVAVNPAGIEVCDGRDNNCDGAVDEGVSTVYYSDVDQDGFGDETTALSFCEPPVGLVLVAGDCDDANADFHPSADEPCTEDIDNNCDGTTAWADDDADGWALCEDCDDLNPDVSPEDTEICNGIDDDCDGEADPVSSFDVLPFYADTDGDSYGDINAVSAACAAPPGYVADTTDCDDTRADVNPGAPEVCDSLDTDENCNGYSDDNDTSVDVSTYGAFYDDDDVDSFGDDATLVNQCNAPRGSVLVGGDCRDSDSDFYPGAPETDCSDPNDYNCDGSVAYADADGDGFAACIECDDSDGSVNPAASELCNGVDDDCDGVTDPDSALDSLTWYEDADSDLFGNAAVSTLSCSTPAGYVADNTDCDDTNGAVYPGAGEYCNTLDDDCDGVIDPTTSLDALTWYADSDVDTYGDPLNSTPACEVPAGFVADDTDCDDSRADVNPGATEICDAADTDEDCDTVADDDDSSTDVSTMSSYYADNDSDTYGNPTSVVTQCETLSGYVADNTDCDDTRSGVNPGASEYCDALDDDEDCDLLADDDDPSVAASTLDTWYEDNDSDSYGSTVTTDACDVPSGYTGAGGDCDDASSSVNPAATEVCDSVDNDCDGTVDMSGGSSLCFSGPMEFESCAATGYTGPTQAQCDTAYSGTSLDGDVTVDSATQGIQEWEVPTTGDYIIEAWGAQGYAGDPGRSGGLGAYATGTFSLTAGEVLYIVVGQKGTGGVNSGGGGGGSFVVDSGGSPLVVAGGGGGTRLAVAQNGCNGRSGQYGGYGSSSSATSTCTARTSGLGVGGAVSGVSWGSGGAGFGGDGAGEVTYASSWGGYGGKRWTNGMIGGLGNAGCGRADGGFGGGGSGNGCYGGGGGGGYSGGDGGRLAGGGGSYVDSAGTASTTTAGVQTGAGAVTIDM